MVGDESDKDLTTEERAGLEKEYEELLSLERRLLANEYEVHLAQRRERADVAGAQVTAYEDHGAYTVNSLVGHGILFDCYRQLSSDSISEGDSEKLSLLSRGFQQMAALASYDCVNSAKAQELAIGVLDEFSEDNPIYLASNTKGHHFVIKYSIEDGEYYRTMYDAGDNTVEGRDTVFFDRVMPEGVEATEIGAGTSMRKEKVVDKESLKVALEHDIKFKELNKRHLPSSVEVEGAEYGSKEVVGQKTTNCNTRSNREMLRYEMPEAHFRSMYDMLQRSSYEMIYCNQ